MTLRRLRLADATVKARLALGDACDEREARPAQSLFRSMESPHPDERPPKKRRFFEDAEDDSPPRIVSPDHRPASASPASIPSPAKTSFDSAPSLPDIHTANNALEHGDNLSGWDADMLQAVVGELPDATLRKLKDVSSGDVQRGSNTHAYLTRKP